jgi:hypothetical protein
MIFLGDIDLAFESLENINSYDDIVNTKSNSVVLFDYNQKLMNKCIANNINYAVEVSDINQLIFSNTLMAKYILVEESLALKAQKIADDYMYDSKIIVKINNINKLQWVASNVIDGVFIL